MGQMINPVRVCTIVDDKTGKKIMDGLKKSLTNISPCIAERVHAQRSVDALVQDAESWEARARQLRSMASRYHHMAHILEEYKEISEADAAVLPQMEGAVDLDDLNAQAQAGDAQQQQSILEHGFLGGPPDPSCDAPAPSQALPAPADEVVPSLRTLFGLFVVVFYPAGQLQLISLVVVPSIAAQLAPTHASLASGLLIGAMNLPTILGPIAGTLSDRIGDFSHALLLGHGTIVAALAALVAGVLLRSMPLVAVAVVAYSVGASAITSPVGNTLVGIFSTLAPERSNELASAATFALALSVLPCAALVSLFPVSPSDVTAPCVLVAISAGCLLRLPHVPRRLLRPRDRGSSSRSEAPPSVPLDTCCDEMERQITGYMAMAADPEYRVRAPKRTDRNRRPSGSATAPHTVASAACRWTRRAGALRWAVSSLGCMHIPSTRCACRSLIWQVFLLGSYMLLLWYGGFAAPLVCLRLYVEDYTPVGHHAQSFAAVALAVATLLSALFAVVASQLLERVGVWSCIHALIGLNLFAWAAVGLSTSPTVVAIATTAGFATNMGWMLMALPLGIALLPTRGAAAAATVGRDITVFCSLPLAFRSIFDVAAGYVLQASGETATVMPGGRHQYTRGGYRTVFLGLGVGLLGLTWLAAWAVGSLAKAPREEPRRPPAPQAAYSRESDGTHLL